jgi:hypothetical protein
VRIFGGPEALYFILKISTMALHGVYPLDYQITYSFGSMQGGAASGPRTEDHTQAGIDLITRQKRRKKPYSPEELDNMLEAHPKRHKRIMRKREIDRSVADVVRALKIAFKVKVLVPPEAVPPPVKAHLHQTINLTSSTKGRKERDGNQFKVTCF